MAFAYLHACIIKREYIIEDDGLDLRASVRQRAVAIGTDLGTSGHIQIDESFGALAVGQIVHAFVSEVGAVGDAQVLQVLAESDRQRNR